MVRRLSFKKRLSFELADLIVSEFPMNTDFFRLLILPLLLAVGCSNAVEPPPFDGPAIASDLFQRFDEDGNEKLDAAELSQAPGYKSMIANWGADPDSGLTRDDILRGFEKVELGQVGLMAFSCGVTYSGEPLEGATIKFVPASGLEGFIEPGEGITGPSGRALVQHESSGLNAGLLKPGIYRVEITHPSKSIDAKFNSQTTLGHTATAVTS